MKPSQSELQNHLKDILELPERVKNYDVLLKQELLLHTEKRINKILGSINNLLLTDSNFEYPKEYLPNKQFQYWSEHVSQFFNYYELQFLKETISNSLAVSENLKNEDFYPFKNNEVKKCFSEYTKKHIIDSYSDYSYLFQRLLKEKLIYPVKHQDFIKWLYKNEFIKEPTYKMFIIKNQFYSLNKSFAAGRENNFNNIFSALIK